LTFETRRNYSWQKDLREITAETDARDVKKYAHSALIKWNSSTTRIYQDFAVLYPREPKFFPAE